MQPQEIEKIRQLVKVSSLLSQSEKEEWLVLVPIMNDKQLGELKGILLSSTDGTNRTDKTDNNKNQPTHIPPLTHIMNLPKAGTAVFPKAVSSIKYQVSSIEQAEKEAKDQNKTGFWQKIKDVLSEKELPAGHKEASGELLLSDHSDSVLAIKETLAENAKKEKSTLEPVPKQSLVKPPEKPVVPRPQPKKEPLPVKPPTQALGALDKFKAIPEPKQTAKPEIPKKLPEPLKPKDEEVTIGTLKVSNLIMSRAQETGQSSVYNTEPLPAPKETSRVESMRQDKREAGSDADFFVPGLKDARILMDAKLRSPGSSRSGLKDASTAASDADEESLGEAQKHYEFIDIHTLEQVGKLRIKDLMKDIVPPLKNLSGILGYHKLVLALEKSPLFQSYINTGLAVLGGKYDLESGEYQEKTLERYLTKDEFERMLDVLRAIKS